MDKVEVISSSFLTPPQEDVPLLLPDDLKHLTDFFSLLIRIDQKSKKGSNGNELRTTHQEY